MSVRVIAGILVVMLVGAGAGEDAAKTDLKKMQGTWLRKSLVKDGEANIAENLTLTFDGAGAWVVKKDDDVIFKGTSKLDPSRSPKQLDLTLTAPDENKDVLVQGIYELKDDTFRICWTINGERPTEFTAKEGSGRTYAVFKRAKAK